jgi:16S rRNA A1518/A1519 N6-dimethyltransferase RsmA/KsgA/DIM1 with predicted DNA glycosylase/AP lyase activity
MSVAHSLFSSKAEKYARYRWDYAQQAIHTILDKTQPTSDTLLLDVGAGTGILTRHFTGIAGRVLALEPNPEMRRLAARGMPAVPSAWVVGDGV